MTLQERTRKESNRAAYKASRSQIIRARRERYTHQSEKERLERYKSFPGKEQSARLQRYASDADKEKAARL